MAQIQIWTRDVSGTTSLGSYAPQHTFLIKINDDGTREILRGGPINDNMIADDIEIVKQSYDRAQQGDGSQTIDYFDPSSGSDPLRHQFQTIKSSTQSEIDTLWNNAFAAAQNINSQNYDYEAFTQNCNTATALMADAMGLKTEVQAFLNQVNVETPGFDSGFNHSISDKIYDLITHPTDEFNKILDFIKQNPNTEFENGNTNDFNNIIKHALEEKLQQSLISSTITDFLFSLTQAEAMQFSARRDPLTLDLNHNNQIDLISLNDSNAFFDLSGDGIKNKVGWVGGNDNNNDGIIDDANNNGTRLDDADGFLVLDANNNNVVDNINELFGYQDANGNIVEGTEELATHDSNHDGRIDASDAVFNQLKIWQDFNGNGTTDAGELSTLNGHNITTINVNNTTTTNQNIDGNVIISTGAYNYTDPNNANQTAGILANLNLAIDQTNSSAYTYQDEQGNTISYNLNLETLTLPFSRGYGFFREKKCEQHF